MEKREQVNHFLTMYIGECWHDYHVMSPQKICYKCGKVYTFNPDFYTPNDRERLFRWMEKNEAELWEEYIGHIITANRDNPKGEATVNAIFNPSNLFEFLKEKRSEWGYIDTHVGNMADGKIMHRDIHPAANYLNTLEAKND